MEVHSCLRIGDPFPLKVKVFGDNTELLHSLVLSEHVDPGALPLVRAIKPAGPDDGTDRGMPYRGRAQALLIPLGTAHIAEVIIGTSYIKELGVLLGVGQLSGEQVTFNVG